MNDFRDTLDSACLPVHPLLRVSICVQNLVGFCQSTGKGIKSHLATALVFFHRILHC